MKSEWDCWCCVHSINYKERERERFWIHAWGVDRQVRTYYATMYMYRERSTLTTEDNGKVSRNGEWSWWLSRDGVRIRLWSESGFVKEREREVLRRALSVPPTYAINVLVLKREGMKEGE